VLLLAAVLSIASFSASVQQDSPAAFFIGKWTAEHSSGPATIEVAAGEGGKLIVTVDGQKAPLDGRLHLNNQVRPPEPFAIVAQNAERLFILRREGDGARLEMYSALPRRPATFWSDRFTKVK